MLEKTILKRKSVDYLGNKKVMALYNDRVFVSFVYFFNAAQRRSF
jgi:hypothetical protein